MVRALVKLSLNLMWVSSRWKICNKSIKKRKLMFLSLALIRQYLVWWPPHCHWLWGSPLPPPRAAPGWHVAPCCWLTGSSSSCPGRWAGLRAAGPHSHSEEGQQGTARLEVSVCRRSYLRAERHGSVCVSGHMYDYLRWYNAPSVKQSRGPPLEGNTRLEQMILKCKTEHSRNCIWLQTWDF